MQKLFKIPLLFLFVASCIGLFLRYLMISPVAGINYTYFLHGHSHVMFLGWIFNVLFLAFVMMFTDGKGFKVVFWILQFLVAAMLVSFPLQGYGAFSIVFTTLHTFAAFVFAFLFFRSTSGKKSFAVTLARISLVLFVVSSVGPFYLGYLMATGQGQSDLYRFSIYFYLHFQYNGFFFFGILSLLVSTVESTMTATDHHQIRRASILFLVATFPAYCLSMLWAEPAIIFNFIGLIAAIIQVVAMVLILGPLLRFWRENSRRIKPVVRMLWRLACVALIGKVVLQLMSADPRVAIFANEFRAVVIAYLHLVLIGVITLFLLGWLVHKQILSDRIKQGVHLFLGGFFVSEISLTWYPWSDAAYLLNIIVFVASLLMVVGVFVFLFNSLSNAYSRG